MGEVKALKVYKSLLEHTATVCIDSSADCFVFYSDFIPEKDNLFPKANFIPRLQSKDENLGDKMTKAFSDIFQTNRPVIIIGSDCPGLNPTILQEAIQQLENNDFVIGPAKDGGYYLLGMESFSPHVFEDVAWSGPEVYQKSIQNIEEHKQSYFALPMLSDVDYEEDWKEFGWEI